MRHRKTRIATATAAAVVLTLGMAGCGDKTTNDPIPPKSNSPTAATPTKSLTPEEQVTKEAEEALARYYKVHDEMWQDPSIPLDKLKTVETSFAFNLDSDLRRQDLAGGAKQTGTTKFSIEKVLQVSLDNSDPKQGKAPTVQFRVCEDISDVDIVDKNGKSLIDPGRPDRSIARYWVTNYDFKTNPHDAWKVSSFTNPQEERC